MEQTLLSALAQVHRPLEIIVVDDGSTDRTAAVAQRFEAQGVKLLRQANAGAAAARNAGLKDAKGDYIQFLDSDDLLNPIKISAQLALLASRPGWLANCSTVHFADGQDPFSGQSSAYEDRFLDTFEQPDEFLVKLWGGYDVHGSMVSSNAWLVPRAVALEAGYWDERLSYDDDGEYFARVILRSKGIVYCAEALNYYRKYPANSLSDLNSPHKLASMLLALQSKKRELLAVTTTAAAKLAIHKLLMVLAVKSYPRYPDIYRAAIAELPAGVHRYPVHVGGPLTNLLARVFGWKAARRFQQTRTS